MQEASSYPQSRAHPVLAQIVDELSIIGEQVALHPNRFHHWVGELLGRFPLRDNERLYAQLVGLALDLAPLRCLGALQLFVLGTLHLTSAQAAMLTDHAGLAQAAAKLRDKAAAVDGRAGVEKPKSRGAGLRRAKREH